MWPTWVCIFDSYIYFAVYITYINQFRITVSFNSLSNVNITHTSVMCLNCNLFVFLPDDMEDDSVLSGGKVRLTDDSDFPSVKPNTVGVCECCFSGQLPIGMVNISYQIFKINI